MKKTLSVFLALALMLGLLTACGGGSTGTSSPSSSPAESSSPAGNSAAAAGTFKIGGTGPLTGNAAIYGTSANQGAQLAVEEINALGGIQFALNYQDDTNDAETAVNAYNSLKDWGMQISLSSVTSTPGVATSAKSNTDRIFSLTPSASSTSVTEGYDNVFQMCFADPNQGSASAQYIADKKLGTKIAVIYKNDDVYSTGIYQTFLSTATSLGLTIVSTTTFTEDSQTDFSVQIADAKNSGADLIFLPIYYTPASLIFKQADTIGYHPKYFGVDGMDGILTLQGFDTKLAEGVMLLTPFSADATDTRTVNFVKNYTDKYGSAPTQFAADGYDCVYAIYNAILSSNNTITPDMSASAICDKLIAIFTGGFTFDGLTGTGMTWNASGQVSKQPKAVVIQDGAYVGMD